MTLRETPLMCMLDKEEHFCRTQQTPGGTYNIEMKPNNNWHIQMDQCQSYCPSVQCALAILQKLFALFLVLLLKFEYRYLHLNVKDWLLYPLLSSGLKLLNHPF